MSTWQPDNGAHILSFHTLERIGREHGAVVAQAVSASVTAGDAVKGTTSPNPPVGASLFDDQGVVSTGGTSPAGGPHAEINALRNLAGRPSEGLSAAVTLEPCNHTGRTGPCSHALLEAGIRRVFYLSADENPQAQGGAEFLREHGVEVFFLDLPVQTILPWKKAIEKGRPAVTVKWAHTLDGFIAAPDGTSQWITGERARRFVHRDRSQRDAILVGTGTVLTDDPQLTARTATGPYENQPLRVVVGTRYIPESFHLGASRDPNILSFASIEAALSELWERGARDVLVEGGAGLITSFFETGLVDFIHDYTAPKLLGAGIALTGWPGARTMADIKEFRRLGTRVLGEDVLSILGQP